MKSLSFLAGFGVCGDGNWHLGVENSKEPIIQLCLYENICPSNIEKSEEKCNGDYCAVRRFYDRWQK